VIKDGAKMSKSLGNVVSPDEMIARYGADAARLYSLFAAPPDRDLDWQDDGIAGIQRFLGKVHRFVEANARPQDPDWRKPLPALTGSARQLQRKLHQTIKRVSDDFQGRWHFNTCISAIMELVNEARSVTAHKSSPGAGENGNSEEIPITLLAEVQRTLVLLLAPFAPYLAHELWEMLGETGNLLKVAWPRYDAALAKEDELEIPVQVNGKLRGLVVVPADSTEDFVIARALADVKVQSAIAGKQIVKTIFIPGKLVNIVVR
jgi:leucyl-tRNA synthetase